jgi:transcriptional regulator with XRE-family HTH domain
MIRQTEVGELAKLMGEVLREIRKGKKLTLRELSNASGVALGYLSEIERAEKDASSQTLSRLLFSLDISLIDFLLLVAEKAERK